MELVLVFVLSGAVSWGLSALLLLAFLHAVTHAAATRMGLPRGAPSAEATRPRRRLRAT